MGVSNAQHYSLTEHFKKRAKERFGIEPEKALKWFRGTACLAAPYFESGKKHSGCKMYRYRNIILVLKESKKEAVTCYPAIDLVKSPSNIKPLKQEVEGYSLFKGIDKDLVKDAKDNVSAWEEEIVAFSSSGYDEILDSSYPSEGIIDNSENAVIDDGTELTIHDFNYPLFLEELEILNHKYELKDGRDYLRNIEGTIERFYKNFVKVADGDLSEEKYKLLQEIIEDGHIINHSIRIIEEKRKEYRAHFLKKSN